MCILCSFLHKIWCLFYLFSTSQFGLATLELLNNYMWLVAARVYPHFSQNHLMQKRCSHSDGRMFYHWEKLIKVEEGEREEREENFTIIFTSCLSFFSWANSLLVYALETEIFQMRTLISDEVLTAVHRNQQSEISIKSNLFHLESSLFVCQDAITSIK